MERMTFEIIRNAFFAGTLTGAVVLLLFTSYHVISVKDNQSWFDAFGAMLVALILTGAAGVGLRLAWWMW